jgi:hypothetical protein
MPVNVRAELKYGEGSFADSKGEIHYTLFVDGYEHSVGYLMHDTNTGEWHPYCLGWNDVGVHFTQLGRHGNGEPTFSNRDSAMAWITEQFTQAVALRDVAVAPVMDYIRANLSPVRHIHGHCEDPSKVRVIVKLIFTLSKLPQEYTQHIVNRFVDQWTCTCEMTIQEALTALDILYTDCEVVPVIEGERHGDAFQYRSFCKWTIPGGDTDYHLLGWRSLTGFGRYGRPKAA